MANLFIPNDSDFDSQWGLNNTGQTGGTNDADIDAPEAWAFQQGSRDVVVAVIDTGVDFNHEDLNTNMWSNPNEIAGNNIDDDGNGYVDDIFGVDFADNDSDPFDDGYPVGHLYWGHGTHVAGTIGAVTDNGIGVAGVSPNVSLMALKSADLGQNGLTVNSVVNAIDYSIAQGANVINYSAGGWNNNVDSFVNALERANDAGILFVAAAGNDGLDLDVSPDGTETIDLPNILVVQNTTSNDTINTTSNFGFTTVDVGAPGNHILSTMPGNQYGYASGTSMAAPHVSGIAALLLAEKPSLRPWEVKQIIMDTVDVVPALAGTTVSGGRVNAARALQAVQGFQRVTLEIDEIVEINRLDSPPFGSPADFRAKVVLDGERFPDKDAPGNVGNPRNLGWKFPTDTSTPEIAISIEVWDRDGGLRDDDDQADINPDSRYKTLNLRYNISANVLFDPTTGRTFTREADGRFYVEGDENTDQTGLYFRIHPEQATVESDGSLLLEMGIYAPQSSNPNETVYIKHISGIAGSEVVEVISNSIPQTFGSGNPGGSFNVIRASAGDGDDVIMLDAVRTAAHIKGGNGNDLIEIINSVPGQTQGSIIVADAGNDTVRGGAGSDSLHGKTGNDILSGGAGDDHITGGGDDDDIEGGAGNDVLSGDSGNPGQDTISGGEGDDIIGGGGNDDTLNGDEGDDVIWGDSSFDIIDVRTPATLRNEGDDTIDGGVGDDEIYGEGGDDYIQGGLGADTLYGDHGDDELYGDAGNDSITGGADQDTISGGEGDDVINAGTGADVIHADVGNDTIDGGSDTDTLDYALAPNSIDANLETGIIQDGWGTQDTVVDYSVENLIGSAQDDSMIGDHQNNQLQAGAGNDRVEARDGDDHIFGEAGNDELFGENGDDWLDGGDGNDYLHGGDGYDTASLASATGPTFTDLLTGTSWGSAGNDTLVSIESISGSEFEDWMGGDHSDNDLSGQGGNDILYGRDGNDHLNGNAGNDRLYGEDGDDELRGETGVDMLKGGAGNDTLDGGADADQLFGEGGDDLLRGGDGADLLEANQGDDTLEGGAGDDRLYGHDGDDLFISSAGYDFVMDGGHGTDTVDYSADPDDVSVNLSTSTAVDGWGDVDRVFNFENIEGADIGNDTLTGNSKANLINGHGGNDKILGGAGDDTIAGGTGDDQQYGEAGNDSFQGDAGNDVIDGGTGKQDYITYRLAKAGIVANLNETQDMSYRQVDRFNAQVDTTNPADYYIDLQPNFDMASGTIKDGFGTTDTVAELEYLDATEFEDIVLGNSANNRINTFAGDDLVFGSAGNDTLDAGDGVDTISYRYSPGKVQVDLHQNRASRDGWQGQDTLKNFENIIGSDHADGDRLVGSSGTANIITAGDGNDYVNGLSGDDTLYGEQGDDEIIGSHGADELHGNQGDDRMWGDYPNNSRDGFADKLYGGAGDDEIHGGVAMTSWLATMASTGSGATTATIP
jgi:Ca2+-binding RTX toxin-like protein